MLSQGVDAAVTVDSTRVHWSTLAWVMAGIGSTLPWSLAGPICVPLLIRERLVTPKRTSTARAWRITTTMMGQTGTTVRISPLTRPLLLVLVTSEDHALSPLVVLVDPEIGH